jgi:hypothetical protein
MMLKRIHLNRAYRYVTAGHSFPRCDVVLTGEDSEGVYKGYWRAPGCIDWQSAHLNTERLRRHPRSSRVWAEYCAWRLTCGD